MTKLAITGFEEHVTFVHTYKSLDLVKGYKEVQKEQGEVVRFIIVNDTIKIPVDEYTFTQLIREYANQEDASSDEDLEKSITKDTPEGADVFGGDIPPIPEETTPSWSNTTDSSNDGVGQL